MVRERLELTFKCLMNTNNQRRVAIFSPATQSIFSGLHVLPPLFHNFDYIGILE